MRPKQPQQETTAVIYARYSSEKQQEISIEGQLRVCREFCQARGWPVVDVYTDRALSAARDVARRDAFQQMVADSARRTFTVVVVYKLSRFARNRYDSAVFKRQLRLSGVRVVSATEAIGDDPQGALFEGIMESLDEYYSRSLAQDVTRGMYDNATKALSTGGAVPYGYRSVDKRLQPDPQAAPIVLDIFSRYADGQSLAFIAKTLNLRGVVNARGLPFSKNSFHSILKNRKYVGEYHYNGQVSLPNAVPPLISADLFEAVQRRLHAQRAVPAKAKAADLYSLNPKAVCGLCGARLAGDCGKSVSGRVYHYYSCGNKRRGSRCSLPSIRKDQLEAYVFDRVLDVLTPANIRLIARQAMQEYARLTADTSALDLARSRLKETNAAMDRIIKAIESGISAAGFIDRANTLEQQRAAILCDIAELERGLPRLTERDIIQFLTVYLTDVASMDSVVNILVNTVVVYPSAVLSPDNIKIILNLTGPQGEPVKCSDLRPLVNHCPHKPNIFSFISCKRTVFLVA
jgi:site-specific DNA recombinase